MSLFLQRFRSIQTSIPQSALLAYVVTAALACSPHSATAQQPRSFRSVNDVRQRIPDELDRPVWRETQSHRGWEIREPQYTVVASTSVEDARWAAAHVKQVWTDASRWADRWTDAHRQPDFALGSTQVVIDNEPPRKRDAPLTTVNVVGIQTQVYLNVSPGQPSLKQQVLQLREAAAFAMLHTVALDSAAPAWVVQGLASHVAEQGLSSADAAAAKEIKLAARFGGQQWRYKRSNQDSLEYPALDGAQAASSIKFLMQGNDGEHAATLLDDIRTAWAAEEQSAASGGQFRSQPGDARPPPADTPFDRLMADLRPQYESWQNDPLVGQPVFEPEPGLSPELLQAEQEMLVVLKLQQRLAGHPPNRRPAARVATFDREKGRQVVVSGRSANEPTTMDDLYQRLNDRAAPVISTLDVDGSLLLSSDTQRIDELLDRAGQRYSIVMNGDRRVLARRFESEQLLQGWLESNPKSPARPLAKFQLVSLRRSSRTTTNERPAAASAARAEVR